MCDPPPKKIYFCFLKSMVVNNDFFYDEINYA